MDAYFTHPAGTANAGGHIATAALPLQARPRRAVVGPPPLARIHSETAPVGRTVAGGQTAADPRPETPALSLVDREMHHIAAMADGSVVTEAAIRRALAVIEEAGEDAAKMRLEALASARAQAAAAEREAVEIIARARMEASRITAQAALEAELAAARARRHADEVMARARGEAEQIVRGARATARTLQGRTAAPTGGAGESTEVHQGKRGLFEDVCDQAAREGLRLVTEPRAARSWRPVIRRIPVAEV
ncbi:MAG: hypothetical protein HY875_11945 [Chloroflexi bacterium]|nr:hypothetical protein [Chloroflexota bacterium]